MSQEKEKEKVVRLGLTLEGEMLKRFRAVKNKWGMESNADVVRMLITDAYDGLPQQQQPSLEHFNVNENGVQILDRDLNRMIQVYFKPDKVLCEYDGSNNCKHVDFALELPEVQEILRKKGWKPK